MLSSDRTTKARVSTMIDERHDALQHHFAAVSGIGDVVVERASDLALERASFLLQERQDYHIQ